MARTTRRQFFQTSAVVSGAFFIGGTKASGDVIGANERVRLAVIGLNGRGKSHLAGFGKLKNVEIASSCTIDRGSIDLTLIGQNTYLDNQVHVAHNVNIGENCMIAGQVGFAGSSTLGNNVSIGGQAGISGHLKIGDNVKIGGGSGVVKDIADDTIVMGYPAVPLKEFLKKENDKKRFNK